MKEPIHISEIIKEVMNEIAYNVIELKADRLYKRLCNGGLILGCVMF